LDYSLFLPKIGEKDVRNVEKVRNVENVQKVENIPETPVNPLWLRYGQHR